MNNILHVYKTYYPDAPGGVQEAIRSICRYTSGYGYRHCMFTLSPNPYPREIVFESVRVCREKQIVAPLSCPIGSWKSFQTLRKLAEIADLVVYHYPWPFGDLLGLGIHGKPSVVLYHSDIVKQKTSEALYSFLRNVFLNRADAIVATSPNYAKSSPVLEKYLGKVKVIPLTSILDNEVADGALIERYNLGSKKFVLFIGVLRYYKGLDTLIKAAKIINCPIVIAGDGPEKYRLQALAEQLGVKNVIFTGFITNAQKKSLLQKASVFAFPSFARSEAFGISLAEAAMYGIPMVSCEIETGTSFINIDRVTGFVVQPNNVSTFAQSINIILHNPELAERMGKAASARWQDKMSPTIFGKSWADLFSNLLNSKYLC